MPRFRAFGSTMKLPAEERVNETAVVLESIDESQRIVAKEVMSS
jgi:hypothetical protein